MVEAPTIWDLEASHRLPAHWHPLASLHQLVRIPSACPLTRPQEHAQTENRLVGYCIVAESD
jgi:hypothetical protein